MVIKVTDLVKVRVSVNTTFLLCEETKRMPKSVLYFENVCINMYTRASEVLFISQ